MSVLVLASHYCGQLNTHNSMAYTSQQLLGPLWSPISECGWVISTAHQILALQGIFKSRAAVIAPISLKYIELRVAWLLLERADKQNS